MFLCVHCCCSVAKSCPTLCNLMDCSMLGFSVLYHLPEFAQTHVHWVSDVIQPFHPISSPSPPVFSLSQHQGLFQWVGSSHLHIGASASASALPMNIQDWFLLGLTGLISLQSKRLSSIFSTPQLESISSLVLSCLYSPLSHPYMTTGKTIALTR